MLRLQPYVSQAATVCIPGCNRMYPRLQPYAATSSSKPREWRSHCATKGPWPVVLTLYICSTRCASAISSIGGKPEAFEMLGAPL